MRKAGLDPSELLQTVKETPTSESLLARLKAGVTGYDVAVPGEYMVAILIKEGLLTLNSPGARVSSKLRPGGCPSNEK